MIIAVVIQMMIIMVIVVLFLMYCFPFITCVHCRENMILSEILSFMHTLGECGKIANTHTYTHDYWFVSVFQEKKYREAKKNDDVSTATLLLLLLLFGRASERADGAGETTKRKAWPTSSGNREEKVCVYATPIG